MKRLDINEAPYMRILLYGLPGSGKTRTAVSATLDPRLSPCLVLNAAGNPLSVRDYRPQPTVLQLEQLSDLNDPYDWLARGQPMGDPIAKYLGISEPFRTVVLDGITEIQRMSFNEQRGIVGPGSFPARVARDHFYNTLGQMTVMANLFFSLPMHVIMTALESTERDAKTDWIYHSPLLWGQSDVEVGGYAYVVARMMNFANVDPKVAKALDDVAEEIHYLAIFAPTGKFYAKDQYFTLGEYMINPTMKEIYDRVIASGAGTTADQSLSPTQPTNSNKPKGT